MNDNCGGLVMKRFISLVLGLIMVLSFTVATAETVKIGVVSPDADHGFTGESVAHIRAELEKQQAENGIEFKFEVGGEAAIQIEKIENILAWGPDAIVLWPLEGEQLRNTAQKIVDAGVKLVIYDRLIPEFEGLSAEIMGDNEEIGRLMGAHLLETFKEELEKGENLQYLLFIGDSSTVSIQRTQGMLEVLEASDYKDQFVQIREAFQTDWSNSKSQEQMEGWLSTTDAKEVADLDFIITHDDEIVDGITLALDNFTGEQNIRFITGVSGRRESLDNYDNREIDFVTYNFSPSMAREAVRLGIAAAKGETYQDQEINGQLFLIPTYQIDKTNVEEYRGGTDYAERYSLD